MDGQVENDKYSLLPTYLVINLQYMSITGRIDVYDETAENILPRNGYQGRGTGGEGIAGKLRMVTCYLLGKIGRDHNTWFHDVKPGFVPTVLDFTTTTSVFRNINFKEQFRESFVPVV